MNVVRKNRMPVLIKFMVAHFGDIFHEWNTRKANQFFALSGISKRNWSILMRYEGMADGKKWTLREIGDDEGISHVRAYQIVKATRHNLEKVFEAMKRGDEVSEG